MLGELLREFSPAARILVLELHARRAERVFRRRVEPVRLEGRCGGFAFGAELRARVGSAAIAAARDDERARALWVGDADMQGRKPAHRKADDVGGLEL